MKINISGKHMELGESFQNHVEARLKEGISKYIDRINHLEVVATKEHHQIRVDIHANTGTHSHVAINGSAAAGDAYAAFDAACDKVEKQLRRYKRRLTNHHKIMQQKETLPLVQAKHYVLSSESADEELAEECAPAIIAERQMNIDHLSVSEAVMRMDLANLPALMFYNSKTDQVNLVYRREDGNIAWVEPLESLNKAA